MATTAPAHAPHAFNRYELKYLVPAAGVAEIRREVAARMRQDGNAGPNGYGVWSLYYDTTGLRFYWEKIEGLRFRRKLRIRRYGEPGAAPDDLPVSLEIKQRVNRVTQKRRVLLPYAAARELCDGRRPIVPPDADRAGADRADSGRADSGRADADRAFVDEVLELVTRLDLRPTAITGYRREPYVGVDSDLGLRVTFDHRVRGRDHDLDLCAEAQNRSIISPHLVVMEVKANERAPYWITDLAARHGLQVRRISKYCQSVEAFGRAPRSVFHVPETEDTPLAAPGGPGTAVERQPA
ncbi:polyphosphate polymerase domain-containing protein [Streptomyces sedi]|uniref:Polyphosphate polymerase domain-containing protein n=1 Tax=Streptomyces sedi TaxID=555059 RepID=A0A5C4VEI3_9ACTN|nr:polyphosphate polymerase domain-containing protein [Streptomyces sedi]TNM34252.1 polyphosphate polymerase domain-containing protein [Streptomyces sedi]